MSSSRTRNAANNFIWLAVSVVISSVFPFVIRTLLIRFIGIEYTGVSSLFTSVLQVLNMADLGIESAVLFYLYKPVSEHDEERICAITRLLRKLYLAAGAVILVAGLAVMPFLPYLVAGKAYPAGLNLYVIYLVYLINACFGYLICGYRIVLFKADQKTYVGARLGIVTALIMYVLQIMAICMLHSFYAYTFLLLINAIGYPVMAWVLAKRYYPQIEPAGALEPEFYQGFWKRIGAIALSKLRNVSRNSFDSIVISMFLGLTLLAEYQNYYQVMLIPIMLLGILHNAVGPSLGNSVVEQQKGSNLHVLDQYAFLQNWMACICISCLLNLFQPFVTLWVGQEWLLPGYMVVLFALYFYVLCVSDTAVLLREVTGIWWDGCWISILEAIANLVLNVVLVLKLGLAGVILSTILTILFINLPLEYYYVFRGYFGSGAWKFLLRQLLYGIEIAGIGYASTLVLGGIGAGTIPGLLLKGVLSVAFPSVCFMVLHLRSPRLKEAVEMMQKLAHHS